jgi:hypothetical protein
MNTKQKKIGLMKRWIAALRSGEYKQGIGYLIKDGKYYCCLGVLCDVAKDEFGITFQEDFVKTDMRSYQGMLPEPLSKYLGLDKNYKGYRDVQEELSYRNDTKRNRFTTIANFLEKNILPLLENEK